MRQQNAFPNELNDVLTDTLQTKQKQELPEANHRARRSAQGKT